MEHPSENVASNASKGGTTGIITTVPPMPMTTMPEVKIERQASESYSNIWNQDSKPPWEEIVEQSIARFICHQCQKTFYNENALLNHKKVHHVFGDSSDQQPSKMLTPVPLDEMGPNQFKFYPLSPDTLQKTGTTADGLTKCKFLEDTSFLIVTIREPCQDVGSVPLAFVEANPTKLAVDLRGPFTCTFPSSLLPDQQCGQIFFNCCEYSLHYREEHTKRRKAARRCQICEKPLDRDTYASTTVTAPPTSAISVPKFTFTCRFCAQTFSDIIRHEEHIRIFHARTKPHVCMVCSKRFMQQGGLQQHMRMHTGIRPFACNFCPKAFTQKAGLEQHIRTHTKVKPFKCVVCDKRFSQSVHLRQHMRTHTNIQPFECSVCGKRFKQSSHLNFHVRSHMNELGSGLEVEEYAQRVPESEQLQLLRLPRLQLQTVQQGESLYYGAELPAAATAPPPIPTSTSTSTSESAPRVFPFAYQS